jgi:hypothetical protein
MFNIRHRVVSDQFAKEYYDENSAINIMLFGHINERLEVDGGCVQKWRNFTNVFVQYWYALAVWSDNRAA